jgi:hypothetical protein
MAANPPQSNPAPQSPPPTGPGPTFWSKLVEAAFLFLPKQLEDARKRGLLWVLAVAGFIVFAVPLLVVLMAAASLALIERLNWDVTNKLRESYVSYIYTGFDIERRTGSIGRIDYFQAIDFLISPTRSSSYSINLVPGQRATVSLSTVRLHVTNSECALGSEVRPALLSVRLNGFEIDRLSANDDEVQPKKAEVDARFWKKHLADFDPEQSSFTLEFIPTEYVQKQCASLAVRGSVTVFKDVFTDRKTGAK